MMSPAARYMSAQQTWYRQPATRDITARVEAICAAKAVAGIAFLRTEPPLERRRPVYIQRPPSDLEAWYEEAVWHDVSNLLGEGSVPV